MSNYYRSQRRRNLYDPAGVQLYKLSRSKLDLFIKCPRCFYLDRRLGIGQPPSFPFNLNSAVDTLLKKEFDFYRQRRERHPLLIENDIPAIPFLHPQLDEWRDSLRRGIQFHVPDTNIILTGGIDDLWINIETQTLIIVDYKATSKAGTVNLDAEWQVGYKRQIEIYQWLFRRNDFNVSDTAYFVYCNGLTTPERFDQQLRFEISLIPYVGKTDWVENVVRSSYDCLCAKAIPAHGNDCDFCQYILSLENIRTADIIG